ncbi:hypothetical protein B5807_02331 [Epicoccum nigrum]|uniref:Heterokaryon incompatibility domain-containing protein n=1 Tax=Epicoccum nigrum TaxID=105696 RepID=A0A1Y2MA12_EPING|nr:hypothetical protein B5807_02331 [Epicoccum nigrum]
MTKDHAPREAATCYLPLEVGLEQQATQFRIATLLPGEWHEPIRCRLTVHSLQSPPSYETISYAWGDAHDTNRICISDVEVTIPNSLWLCLRHLRDKSAELALWTDAICIDQSNPKEKAAQVVMMGEIYSRCSSMYIWLGEPGALSQACHPFSMFLHWAEDKHFYEYPGFSRTGEGSEWVFSENAAYQQMYEEFVDVVSRPWWTRLWCVQEIALCPSAVIVLGTWRMPWAKVLRAKDNHCRHVLGCCEGVSNALPARYIYFWDHMLFLSQRFDMTGMDQIIRSLRHKLCKDPRDKVYGLLGLLWWKNPRAWLHASYSVPVGKLYQEVTETIMEQADGDLHFLTGSGLGSDSYHLPSWVRNFAAPLSAEEASQEYSRWKAYTLYNAAAQTNSEAKVVDASVLSLSGTLVDRIERIGTSIQEKDWSHIGSTILAWASLAGISSLTRTPGLAPSQDRFWRTLLADCIPATHSGVAASTRIPTAPDESLSEWFFDAQARLEEGEEPLITPQVHAFWRATHGRTFFCTVKGGFGLCFPHARPGDEVWVLVGGRVPFVLQGVDDAVEDSGGDAERLRRRRLVGECYLHGFMNGEAKRMGKGDVVSVHLV